ncbi:MAG: bifunctional diaminohydroxyphosphoribosylaminopyrimidine deaminase/5-amino-6-(5-phosphoribosylamino)uracil reductase RibD [Acidobacteriota bacterium]
MTPSKGAQATEGNRFSSVDRDFLKRCIRLAGRARGATSPNPMVGSMVVHGGEVVAQGYHHCAGSPHAEQLALAAALGAAKGATLYTNIEPCCHHGRTPPCVEAIRAAGIERVVACMADPDPRVDHRGFEFLRAAGIRVDVGELAEQAAGLNEAYLTFKRYRRPFFLAKAAISLDGRMATSDGQSQWISGEQARRRGHRLRAVADAVLVGVGTVLADDPRLTARHARGPGPRYRVVLDASLRTPAEGKLLAASAGQVLIFTTPGAPSAARQRLEAAGAEVIEVEPDAGGRVAWDPVLSELAAREVMLVLLEGGSTVLTSAFEAGIIDKLFLIYAPLLIGGAAALSLWEGEGNVDLGAAPRLHKIRRFRLGEDWVVEGYLHPPQLFL